MYGCAETTNVASARHKTDAINNLRQVNVHIADLSSDNLGIASDTNYVWIDRDAAGYGWQMNSLGSTTPRTNSGMDLISVVAHELGHKLGFEHSHDDIDVMAPTLAEGVRTIDGNQSRVIGTLGGRWNYPYNRISDDAVLSRPDSNRSVKHNSEELRTRDQLFAGLDSGAVMPRLRQAIVASKFASDAKQKSALDPGQLLDQDFMDAIVVDRITRQ